MRLRKAKPEPGRVVNGVEGQVVPRGTVRAIIRSHKRDLQHVSDALARETARREAATRDLLPAAPDEWTADRGRRQLLDLEARAKNG